MFSPLHSILPITLYFQDLKIAEQLKEEEANEKLGAEKA